MGVVIADELWAEQFAATGSVAWSFEEGLGAAEKVGGERRGYGFGAGSGQRDGSCGIRGYGGMSKLNLFISRGSKGAESELNHS